MSNNKIPNFLNPKHYSTKSILHAEHLFFKKSSPGLFHSLLSKETKHRSHDHITKSQDSAALVGLSIQNVRSPSPPEKQLRAASEHQATSLSVLSSTRRRQEDIQRCLPIRTLTNTVKGWWESQNPRAPNRLGGNRTDKMPRFFKVSFCGLVQTPSILFRLLKRVFSK